jgi:hypothetical protein
VGCEDGVDERRLSESSLAYCPHQYTVSNDHMILLTNTDDVELKSTLQELLLNLLCDAIKANVTSWEDSVPLRHCHGHGGLPFDR